MSTDAVRRTLAPAVIFCGGYGSGKSELAVNYALAALEHCAEVAIADIDVVNPYFRSREVKQQLEAQGVRVIAPKGDLITADLPALPPEVEHILRNDAVCAVIDVGGSDTGARVLGRYEDAVPDQARMYLVVNVFRPGQETPQGIAALAERIMGNAQMRFDGVINNSNLLHFTTVEQIEESHSVVAAAAAALGVPVVFTVVNEKLADREGLPAVPTDFLLIKLQLSPEWREN